MAEEVRSVKLPNGRVYINVPSSVSDSDAWEIWKSQNGVDERQPKVEPEEIETPPVSGQDKVDPTMGMYGTQLYNLRKLQNKDTPETQSYGEMADNFKDEANAVKIDFGRLFADKKTNLTRLGMYGASRLMPSDQRKTVTELLDNPEFQSFVAEETAKPIARAIDEDVRTIYDSETGRIFPMDTAVGTAAEVGTYFVGGIGAYKNLPSLLSSSPRWADNFYKGTASGVIVDQLLTNPDQNVSTLVKDALGEEASKEFNNYLVFATDADDSESIKRLKLIGEGAMLGAIIDVVMGGVGGANQFRKFIKNKFNKTPEQLTKEDKGTLLVDYAKEQKKKSTETFDAATDEDILQDAASIRNLQEQAELRFNETPEGEAQVRLQQSSFLQRLLQGTFTSRGYWTPRAFDAFNDSLYAQRATVNEAEVIARKLNESLKTFSDQDPEI